MPGPAGRSNPLFSFWTEIPCKHWELIWIERQGCGKSIVDFHVRQNGTISSNASSCSSRDRVIDFPLTEWNFGSKLGFRFLFYGREDPGWIYCIASNCNFKWHFKTHSWHLDGKSYKQIYEYTNRSLLYAYMLVFGSVPLLESRGWRGERKRGMTCHRCPWMDRKWDIAEKFCVSASTGSPRHS